MNKLTFGIIMALFAQLVSSSAIAKEPIKVVTTIGQITDIVKNVGGDNVAVKGLMGAGVDPHLYKASESDVTKLSSADIIFYNGLKLEAKLEDILEKMSHSKKIVAISKNMPRDELLDSLDYPGHYDPHVWFDIPLWSNAAKIVATTLIEHDPENSEQYAINLGNYLAKLDDIHNYTWERSQELDSEQRVLVTAHDAFRYFGHRYDFEVIGLQGISTEAEAGTADIIELANMIAKREIRAIYVESSVPERNIKAVQEAVRAKGWDVIIGGELFSDAMGDTGTFEGTYVGMITHNIDTIVEGLKK